MTPFRLTKCPPFPTEWGTSRSLMGDTRCPPRKERNESKGASGPNSRGGPEHSKTPQPPHLQPVDNSPDQHHHQHHHHPTTHTHTMNPRNTHQRHRRTWNATIRTLGQWTCRRCLNNPTACGPLSGQPIKPGDPYDLGHPNDATPGGPTNDHRLEPEHPHGNRSAGATAGNLARNNRIPPSRNW